MNTLRRHFLKVGLGMGSALALAPAFPAEPPRLAESDPAARALGYRLDAGQVDKAKYPTYVVGHQCSNCSLYQGADGAAWGECTLFAGKLVSARGWCSSYTNF